MDADAAMEARIAVLERIANDTKEALAGIRSDIAGVRGDVLKLREETAELKGRVSQLPSAWQMITAIVGGQIALAVVLGGAATLVIRFTTGH